MKTGAPKPPPSYIYLAYDAILGDHTMKTGAPKPPPPISTGLTRQYLGTIQWVRDKTEDGTRQRLRTTRTTRKKRKTRKKTEDGTRQKTRRKKRRRRTTRPEPTLSMRLDDQTRPDQNPHYL